MSVWLEIDRALNGLASLLLEVVKVIIKQYLVLESSFRYGKSNVPVSRFPRTKWRNSSRTVILSKFAVVCLCVSGPCVAGIGLAHLCNALGYKCVIYMPNTQSYVRNTGIYKGSIQFACIEVLILMEVDSSPDDLMKALFFIF